MSRSVRRDKAKGGDGRFWRDNGLTITLFSMFLCSLVGQAFTGLSLYNQTQLAHGIAPVRFAEYLRTGDFLDGVFANWQAAVLQLASLILFGAFLRQRGAAHSRKAADDPGKRSQSSTPKRRGWFYSHSLSIALLALFVTFFVFHLLAGNAAYRQESALQHLPLLSLPAFAVSAKFWFLTFQTWEAEYFAIAIYVILTIFLRQDRSPESKPVDATDKETGEVAD